MSTFVFANNVNTTLASPASSSATSLTLASSTNLPSLSAGQIMPLTLNDAATGAVYEIVYVTAISGVTLTVTRAQEGTGAQNWSVGDYAFSANTAGTTAVSTGDSSKTFQVASGSTSAEAVNLAQMEAYAEPIATASSGVVGQFGNIIINAGASGSIALPSGGTWIWSYFNQANTTGGQGQAGVSAGGSTVFSGTVSVAQGWCKRIA